jgi:hypothetical protein
MDSVSRFRIALLVLAVRRVVLRDLEGELAVHPIRLGSLEAMSWPSKRRPQFFNCTLQNMEVEREMMIRDRSHSEIRVVVDKIRCCGAHRRVAAGRNLNRKVVS